MRVRSMLLGLIFALATGRAGADTKYTFDFSSLAADAGQVVPIVQFEAGPFTASFYDVLVIGPGDPGYTGQIGILPSSGTFLYLADFEGGFPAPFSANSISAVFAPGATDTLDVGALSGSGFSHWIWGSSLSGPTTEVFTPSHSPAFFGLLDLYTVNGNGAQMLSLTLDGPTPPSTCGVPEPPAALLLCCGMLGLLIACRTARVATR
jgi:hypothetical protein